MPLPLKPGYNFNYDRTKRPPYYEMSAAEAYTDFYGISFMISGERLIYSEDFTTLATANELVFIPKNVFRRTTYVSNIPYERILIKFTDSMISELIDTIGIDMFNELCSEHVIHFNEETQPKILGILKEMEKEWNSYNSYSELILKGLLNKLIITCIRERIVGGKKILSLEQHHNHLANSIKYIKTHLYENPTLEDTAKHINISASYLSKIFVSHLHTPYSTFVANEKIAFAQKLLTKSNMSITDIAFESGFSSISYFSYSFKQNCGLSPNQFRKKIASGNTL